MALAAGFEQEPDSALQGESDLTGGFPRMLIVDEYPVRGLLLAKDDDLNNLNFARIKRLRPGAESRRQDHLNYVDVTWLHKKIDGCSIVRSKTQAVNDYLVIDLVRNIEHTQRSASVATSMSIRVWIKSCHLVGCLRSGAGGIPCRLRDIAHRLIMIVYPRCFKAPAIRS
jgi:hypothetical protein